MLNRIIIIGGGLSGAVAAHTALEHGLNVTLLEKNSFCGGNSSKATSGLNACRTKSQIKQGIKDSVEAFEKDTILSSTLGKNYKPFPLARILVENSSISIDWLINKFKLDLSVVSRLGGHSFPRTHRGRNRFPGMTITFTLLEKLEEIEKNSNGEKVKIINNAKANKLIKDKKGNIIGIEYIDLKNNDCFKLNGVIVICTGGFSADFFSKDSLINKYRPDLINLSTTNGSFSTGDGMKMCKDIGAELIDMNYIQIHPTGLVNPKDPNNKTKFLAAEALRGVGGIILNGNGERFCDELGRRDYISEEMFKNKPPFRLLLNSAASKDIHWHCKHYVGLRLMKFCPSAIELIKELNIPLEKLEKTFTKYSNDAKKGLDDFGKKYFQNGEYYLKDSFYVAIITPVIHYTMGGIRISSFCEVMKDSKSVLPGVFAAGEVTGGVHGKNRLGGNSLAECLVFGRIAGSEAAKYLLNLNIKIGKEQNMMIKDSFNNAIKRIEILNNHLKK